MLEGTHFVLLVLPQPWREALGPVGRERNRDGRQCPQQPRLGGNRVEWKLPGQHKTEGSRTSLR